MRDGIASSTLRAPGGYAAEVAADPELIGAIRAALRAAAQPGLAGPMQAYMKSATPYLGVRVPAVRALTRTQARPRPPATPADLSDTVLALWRAADYREERYAAIALLDTPAARRVRDPSLLETLRELIVTGAGAETIIRAGLRDPRLVPSTTGDPGDLGVRAGRAELPAWSFAWLAGR